MLATNVVKGEGEQAKLKPTSIRIPLEVMKVLDLVATEKELSRSKVIINILDRYANAYRIDIKPLAPNSLDHYALIAPTLYGKTFMAKNLFIPACSYRSSPRVWLYSAGCQVRSNSTCHAEPFIRDVLTQQHLVGCGPDS